MRFFSDPVDRFFVGKFLAGILFFVAVCRALLASLVVTGAIGQSALLGSSPPGFGLLFALVVAGLALWAFRAIEGARLRKSVTRRLGA